jgi:hypothetical protein
MLPSLSLPPVLCCFGTNPIQAARLRPDEKVALEFLNDTYFEASTDTIFILSITAAEALCPELRPTAFFQKVIAALMLLTKLLAGAFQILGLTAKYADMEELEKKLVGLRERGSVRQGYLTKMRALLGNAIAKEFDELYGDRSKFVHEGLGRGSFAIKAYRAREIAQRLLFAEIGPK